MLQLMNHRLKVILLDGRVFIGQMLAFDKHMNLVLADCEEFRTTKKALKKNKKLKLSKEDAPTTNAGISVKPDGDMKRSVGLVILRGENIVSFSVEGGPPPVLDAKTRVSAATMLGQGHGRPTTRGPLPSGLMMPPTATGFPPALPAGIPFPPPPFAVPGFPGMPGMVPPAGMRPPPFPMPGMPMPPGMPAGFPGMPPFPGMPLPPG